MAEIDGEVDRTKRFNRICRILAFLWLAIVLPASFIRSPTYQDFSVPYTGALAIRLNAWDALYPLPIGNQHYYLAENGQGQAKPMLQALAKKYHIKELSPYLNPPWHAISVFPLSWLSFQQAHWALAIINILCMWLVAWAAGRSYELCASRPTRAAGLITLLVACSPLAYRAIRVGNLSPAVAFCIAVTIWDLLGRCGKSGFGGGLAAAWGALSKLATPILLPLALVMRRWRTIAWAIAIFTLGVAITWKLAGAAMFREFFTVVAPSLARSSINPGNKSLEGFLLRASGQAPLPPMLIFLFHALQIISLLLILWLLILPRASGWRPFWRLPPHVFAAATALIAWLLIFSPLCWDHYFLYLCPFWGWLIWEGSLSRMKTIFAAIAIAMNWFPLPVLRWLRIPEPINSYMLVGLIIMFVFAIRRLALPQSPNGLRIPQT